MITDKKSIGLSYLRLSDEDIKNGESASITNQRRIIEDYCKHNDITLVGEFVDDGWSGGNFERPGFQDMMRELQKGNANIVITKDLSRLGRDMRESSYYAEQFFPENNIRYIAILDNFDTKNDNLMAPFQFAMNEVYLRDVSRKVRETLKNKRENGLYYACPPYGYKKDSRNNNLLVPDENTAPIIKRIFQQAASGYSSRDIANSLNKDSIIPPLKYRVLYRDTFSDKGASRASDYWNCTTIKRILKNEVYLGHTVLGKTKKASIKSSKKVSIDKAEWCTTRNTHEALVSEEDFKQAQLWLAKNTRWLKGQPAVRTSIFSGIAHCEKCGKAVCSAGTTYNGEKEKYWYLYCSYKTNISKPCPGVRIKYTDLLEVVKNDLNSFLDLNEEEIAQIKKDVIDAISKKENLNNNKIQLEKAKARISTIDKIISKLYLDNAEGKISNDRFDAMLSNLESETVALRQKIAELNETTKLETMNEKLNNFFDLVQQHTHIDELTREHVTTFIDRIEVGEKIYPEWVIRDTHNNKPFTQTIKIFYKFVGDLGKSTTFKR